MASKAKWVYRQQDKPTLTSLDAITAPADAPATADALRDDLVAGALADIDNNLTALHTYLTNLQTALVSAGVLK